MQKFTSCLLLILFLFIIQKSYSQELNPSPLSPELELTRRLEMTENTLQKADDAVKTARKLESKVNGIFVLFVLTVFFFAILAAILIFLGWKNFNLQVKKILDSFKNYLDQEAKKEFQKAARERKKLEEEIKSTRERLEKTQQDITQSLKEAKKLSGDLELLSGKGRKVLAELEENFNRNNKLEIKDSTSTS